MINTLQLMINDNLNRRNPKNHIQYIPCREELNKFIKNIVKIDRIIRQSYTKIINKYLNIKTVYIDINEKSTIYKEKEIIIIYSDVEEIFLPKAKAVFIYSSQLNSITLPEAEFLVVFQSNMLTKIVGPILNMIHLGHNMSVKTIYAPMLQELIRGRSDIELISNTKSANKV